MFNHQRVSQSFVRNIRKGYLLPDGSPEPGKEELCATLLAIIKALQAGSYDHAVNTAWRAGLDLETMYADYMALVRSSTSLGNYWKRLEEYCNKYGCRIVWNAVA